MDKAIELNNVLTNVGSCEMPFKHFVEWQVKKHESGKDEITQWLR